MDNRTIKRIAKQIQAAADAITEIDPDLVDALVVNDCPVAMPQELSELSERLTALLDPDNAWASRTVAEEENPDKAVWTNEWNLKKFVP